MLSNISFCWKGGHWWNDLSDRNGWELDDWISFVFRAPTIIDKCTAFEIWGLDTLQNSNLYDMLTTSYTVTAWTTKSPLRFQMYSEWRTQHLPPGFTSSALYQRGAQSRQIEKCHHYHNYRHVGNATRLRAATSRPKNAFLLGALKTDQQSQKKYVI